MISLDSSGNIILNSSGEIVACGTTGQCVINVSYTFDTDSQTWTDPEVLATYCTSDPSSVTGGDPLNTVIMDSDTTAHGWYVPVGPCLIGYEGPQCLETDFPFQPPIDFNDKCDGSCFVAAACGNNLILHISGSDICDSMGNSINGSWPMSFCGDIYLGGACYLYFSASLLGPDGGGCPGSGTTCCAFLGLYPTFSDYALAMSNPIGAYDPCTPSFEISWRYYNVGGVVTSDVGGGIMVASTSDTCPQDQTYTFTRYDGSGNPGTFTFTSA